MKKIIKKYTEILFLILFFSNNAYAVATNYTTFVDGNVLNASDLNNFQTWYTNSINAVLDGDTFTGDMNWYSGSDAIFYSNSGVTKTVQIYGNNGNIEMRQSGDLLIYSNDGTTLSSSIDGETGEIIGAPVNVGTYNISIKRGQTSVAGDSVEIECGDATCSATNPGYIVLNGATAGQTSIFKITNDILINLTGATWGAGGTGDLTARILRVLFVNDDGTLKTCVALVGGRTTILTTDSSATQASINLSEEVLCNSAISSATNTVYEVGYVVSDFDDTGGSSEDLNTIQSGVNDVVTGVSPDGIWQPWNPAFSGFSSNPTITSARWTQVGRVIILNFIRTGSGTSNATTFAMTGPVDSRVVSKAVFGNHVDGGTAQTAAGIVKTDLGSDLLTLYKNSSESSTWTNSSTKGADFSISYEAGPAASFVN